MIEPKEITIQGKQFIISKFPATKGREICTQYLSHNALALFTKNSDYTRSNDLMLKLMAYVAVPRGNSLPPLMLDKEELVNAQIHIDGKCDWETGLEIEKEMILYNTSFFQNGRVLTFLQGIALKAQPWITKIVTRLSPLLSQTEKQP